MFKNKSRVCRIVDIYVFDNTQAKIVQTRKGMQFAVEIASKDFILIYAHENFNSLSD